MTEVNKPPKIAILVDGNNFYRGLEKSELLKTSTQLDEFDYSKFAEFIAQGREIGIRKFYKGAVKKEIGNPKSQRMVSEQQRIFARLEFSDWKVVRGKLSKNPEFGSGSTILYVITTILGIGGFTLRIIAWIKNPSSKQKSYY
ncbi:MAG: hypothetical protein AAB700_01570 [Patescibacteria group bacterium]